jgi:Leucine-rich repeat (LRR) protein
MGNLSGRDGKPPPSATVAMSGRQLEEVPDDAIHVGITNLDLSFNKLVDLPVKMGSIDALKFIKLQGNRLTEIPKVLFKPKMVSLESLTLDRNALHRVPNQISILLNLTQLILSRNQVCSCLVFVFRLCCWCST